MYFLLSNIFSGWNERAEKLTLNPTNKSFLSKAIILPALFLLTILSASGVNAATFIVNTTADT